MVVIICKTCGYHVSNVEGDIDDKFERHTRLKHPVPTTDRATPEQLAKGERDMNRRIARITKNWPKGWD